MVSKVLSGRMGNTSGLPETVRAIREKAREMGYRKNLQAEALRTGRLNVIAVCVHHHGVNGSQIVENMVEGIAREAASHQQRMVLQYFKTLDELQSIWSEFRLSAVDGVILGGVPHVDWVQEVNAGAEQDIPVVTILPAETATDEYVNVGMSEREIVRRSTLHLLDCGCKRPAHFYVRNAGETVRDWCSVGRFRYEGYCQALKERGIPLREELVISVEQFHYQYGLTAAAQLLASGVEFDGIVAQSDHQAAAALNVLTREGRRVPHDVRLVGVDNSPFCEMASVPLSSVSQEYEIRGTRAVEMLLKLIDGEDVSSVCVDPVLNVRESSAKL